MNEQNLSSQMPENLDERQPVKRPGKQNSIVPRSSVAGRALVSVVAIMAFLASLTLGAVSLVSATAQSWQSDIAREITIQVQPIEGVDLDAQLVKAQQVVGSFSGIVSITILDDETTIALLEPWLGSGFDMAELPVPRLISVQIDENAPPELAKMREKLQQQVKGASIDDHRNWVDRLNTMARATIVGGLLIFSLVIAATVLTVVFATRGAMAGNKTVIEVLHFVGADQGYIASEFQRHFLLLGLKGALSGGVMAILVFFIAGLWTGKNIADPSVEQVTALFGTFSVGVWGYVSAVVLIFAIAFMCALTSRYTVLRHVGSLERSGIEEEM